MLTTQFLSRSVMIAVLTLHQTTALCDNSSRDQGIRATGSCIKKVAQDRGTITFTTNVLAPTVTEANKKATDEHNRLRQALLALKLENATLETTGFSVAEDRQWENKKIVSKGFRARIGINLETSDIARLGDAIAAAGKIGVKDVEGLGTFVSPEKMKAEYESCLEIASRNARDKAQKIAKGVGVKLGRVLAMVEGAPMSQSSYRGPMKMMAMAETADAEAPMSAPQIDARSQDLSVEVTATFSAE